MIIKKVIYNDPATIVIWGDGSKTVVKVHDGDVFDAEKGLLMAIAKYVIRKTLKSNNVGASKWYKIIEDNLPKEDIKPQSKKKTVKQMTKEERIADLFNKGYTIKEISKLLNVSEYSVRKHINDITKPAVVIDDSKKKKRGKYIRHTAVEFPDWLFKEECEKILAETKEKYKSNPKITAITELQKYFIRECKMYKCVQMYDGGFSMYEIAKVIGSSPASVQRYINNAKNKKED